MSDAFFENPILNSPYERPSRHWELNDDGMPTGEAIEMRRKSDLITPVPKPKKRNRKADQAEMSLGGDADLSTALQDYDPAPIINEIRQEVEAWRSLPNPSDWGVSPETARLLQHWRSHPFAGIRPFFCQVEAVETAIWLTEVAGVQRGESVKSIARYQRFKDHLHGANEQANPDIFRIALKLATGAGKTTVMAMLIAWQSINAVRHPQSKLFTKGFLIVAPGITIKDRLRVLMPNDPESYYKDRELVPHDMLEDLQRAKIVITNYHAFKLRERIELSKGTRQLLQGRGEELQTLETEGQMIQRVMPGLMGMKNIIVINDEAHHCYRERPGNDDLDDLKGDEKKDAQKENEAARMWISGIEAVDRQLGVRTVFDLSATPFFLRGSGYVEGTLFPWTVSDFSLMDAIECGIVKLPRVPVADNDPHIEELPKFRELWKHIAKKMPKKAKGQKDLDPFALPVEFQTALEALYGHYCKVDEEWKNAGISEPPVFIIVCNNTATSKLVYEFVSGFEREDEDGNILFHNGRLELFRNYDEHGQRIEKPNTLLIDSAQLESGDALDDNFRKAAGPEIEQFRREIRERTGDQHAAENISDSDLLREVMNTVGKKGRLGERIRCVVSVSMLTEGWDANTVTHVLGVRAFGTQLLCEQVVGRALRRQSYDLNEDNKFNVEYADVLGIPFDFTAKPVVVKPKPPKETIRVHAVTPERDALEIKFPRVDGYRVELPAEKITANFSDDHILELTPKLVGPSITKNQGILGEDVDLNLEHLDQMRSSTVLFHLTRHLIYTKYRDPGEEPKMHLFGQLKSICRQWLEGGYLKCEGGTYPGQLAYKELADMACNKIKAAIAEGHQGEKRIKAILDAYNPKGSTRYVNFTTSKEPRWQTSPTKCHINWAICDGQWEAEFCRVVEDHPNTITYVKNQNMGFEVPYLLGSAQKRYIPDFIVQIDDGQEDPLNMIVEIKGYRGEDAKEKANTMKAFWVPGVNNLAKFGRWQFAEFTSLHEIEKDFKKVVDEILAGGSTDKAA